MSVAFKSAAAGAVAMLAILGGQAHAADISVAQPVTSIEPNWYDVAFGVSLQSQYVARGLSQSNGHPAVQGYGEIQLFDWVYAGVWAASVDFPSNKGLTSPAGEADLYAGVRHTWDKFTFDAFGVYYYYPGETNGGIDYGELVFHPSYKFNDWLTVTGWLKGTDDFVGTGANELYLFGSAKISLPRLVTLPDVGFYVTGSLGKRWTGKTNRGFNFPDYLVWEASTGATYKQATLDLRYSQTDLSRHDCALYAGSRGWCGSKFILSLSFDTTLSALKN